MAGRGGAPNGIPASILESELAQRSQPLWHQCHNIHDDDEKGECFRVPAGWRREGQLETDYKGWGSLLVADRLITSDLLSGIRFLARKG